MDNTWRHDTYKHDDEHDGVDVEAILRAMWKSPDDTIRTNMMLNTIKLTYKHDTEHDAVDVQTRC